jgi:hypothetical protein
MDSNSTFGEIIYSYSRAQALEDGVLVDLTQFQNIREHWKIPVACTDTVWNAIEGAVQRHGKDFEGICHDISIVAKLAIRRATPGQTTIRFSVVIGHAHKDLKLHVGPGDAAEPVLTLMLPHED